MTYEGIPASAGIGIGQAVVLREPDLDYTNVRPAGAEAEKARLRAAAEVFTARTTAMAEAMKERVGAQRAAILSGQAVMLSDPFLLGRMEERLDAGMCAEAAADAVCRSFIALFSGMDDELMRQRATDLSDLRMRLLGILLGRGERELGALPAGTVLVAQDLTPSMAAGLDPGRIAGILTEAGGVTSHSAILARAMEVPAVFGVPGITGSVRDGARVILDGVEGTVLVEPGPAALAEYTRRRELRRREKSDLSRYRSLPTVDADGRAVGLLANIGSIRDADAALQETAEGIGLFRTEFLFLDRGVLPTEEEQFEVYRAVAERFSEREVILRTLDVGGDKSLPCLGLEREANPLLGFRAIRYCLGRQDVFVAQLRALLRASAFGNLKVMLPLVTCVDEVRSARALMDQIASNLERDGIAHKKDLQLGVMIETPAAALIADLLARECDFFSIGTNDLTQHTMAADRGNGKVSYLYSPLHPAMLRSIRAVIRAGREAGIPVGMCGEAAAEELLIPLLLSFGLTEFSVRPSALLSTRKCIAQWGRAETDELAKGAMLRSTESEVRGYLNRHRK